MQYNYTLKLKTADFGDSGTKYRIHYKIKGITDKGHLTETPMHQILSCRGISRNNGEVSVDVLVDDMITPTSITFLCEHSDLYRPAYASLHSGSHDLGDFPNYSSIATEGKAITIPAMSVPDKSWDETGLACPPIKGLQDTPNNSNPTLVFSKKMEDLGNEKFRTLKVSAFYKLLYIGTALKGSPVNATQEMKVGITDSTRVLERASITLGVQSSFASIQAELTKETERTQTIEKSKTFTQEFSVTTDEEPLRVGFWQKVYRYEMHSISKNGEGESSIFDVEVDGETKTSFQATENSDFESNKSSKAA
jgi:hypothetical protein